MTASRGLIGPNPHLWTKPVDSDPSSTSVGDSVEGSAERAAAVFNAVVGPLPGAGSAPAESDVSQTLAVAMVLAAWDALSDVKRETITEMLSEERVRRAKLALEMATGGMTRSQIGQELAVGVATVKHLLSLARFLVDPEAFPGRLDYARRTHHGGWTNGEVTPSSERRGVTDARALALTQPEVL